MKKIAVFGGGGHAKVVMDIIRLSDELEIAAVLATAEEQSKQVELLSSLDGGIIAVGDNMIRWQIAGAILERLPDFMFVTVVHPAAVIAADVTVGAGTVVMAGAVINSGASVGSHCIVNTRAAVDHDCHIGDYASIAPGAVLGGGVQVGSCSAIGLGANIIHNRQIGEHTIVGAGATVVHHLPDLVVAYGTPARVIRDRQPGEKYL